MKYLTADFGSTYTKLTVIDSEKHSILGTASAFTTIDTDIMVGFNNALQSLEAKIGKFNYDQLLCCSSARGGLKMVALGFVPELTAKAAKMAASSAGAKVVKAYSFEISKTEQDEIYNIDPDLILLCGGTNGGNKDVIISNAKRLCEINRDFSIIIAGNKSASHELDTIFKKSEKDYIITDNVMPSFNKLEIEPARKAIKELFIKKIVEAKGLAAIQKISAGEVIPTPLAVMNACELLSKGTKTNAGIGEFMAIDLGGATTDIYSMAKGDPTMENMLVKGLPEPFSKRTVEGDLGMRYSLNSLFSELDIDTFETETGIGKKEVADWVAFCTNNPNTITESNSKEHLIEESLAREAVSIAVERHCGYWESTYSPIGEIYSIIGKDLSDIPLVIGIGGAIINSHQPAKILDGVKYNPKKYNCMRPKSPQYMLDKKYIFASMGLLSIVDPDLALDLIKKETQLI
ncbi:methylaspartate mutase accessory protein GlmL [Dysgonomonas sp. BGC7]|uniref:methylaspartate mutase accessory protein GlmL n=1 Tax=Dysgonomonas sp. BGC7 TaxID=1658008 RepID=UPI0006837F95|nr:methylaspartate mutase accessory protein GlmL [Dysgonomonas sp. BGC7]MBD8388651.1 glutamate mutase L [Dysgonomonas sp. BGC7]